MLHNRISSPKSVESQDDVLTVSRIVEDIRDALIDYQVGGDTACVAVGPLKLGRFGRWASSGRYTTIVAS